MSEQIPSVSIGGRMVGPGHPVYVIAEIGINHNGSLDLAKKLIAGAARAGADAVKFQKRTPQLCVPVSEWNVMRDTPWGRMSYIDYRWRLELSIDDFNDIDRYCRSLNIQWFASCWDEESVDFIEQFDPPTYKVASASLTDIQLLKRTRGTGKPMIASTGMSTFGEIEEAVLAIGTDELLIAHSTSSYPCAIHELNLRMIDTLRNAFPGCPIGYSGHEVGLAPTWAAVALGATFVERHITLDRALWGSDHAASVELQGLERLVASIRDIEQALGDGRKRIYASERDARRRLRRVQSAIAS